MKLSQMYRLLDYINHVTSTQARDFAHISKLQHELLDNSEPDTVPPRYAQGVPADAKTVTVNLFKGAITISCGHRYVGFYRKVGDEVSCATCGRPGQIVAVHTAIVDHVVPADYPKMPPASCGVVPRHNRWLYKWIPHPQHMVSVRYKDAGYWYIYVAEYPRTFFARLDTESVAKLICEAVNGFNENRGHAVDYKGEYERLYNSVRELQALVGWPEVFAVDINSLLHRIRELVKS